ncbi:hypothetical protein LTR37_015925 [Vermiconidia calcicola]|uniref:Uncharacterized protein n=1 Tax=Vermiconidia calcicola TaxID=1690605 RepID=A0ACC3MQW5_9PEZI|nr:hypothetical protein LTR37_015925 [Vermiconidia calcicola]
MQTFRTASPGIRVTNIPSLRPTRAGEARHFGEGGQLRTFYDSFNRRDGQAFNVFINNYNGIKYCTGASNRNDGYEFRLENDRFTTFRRDLDGKSQLFLDRSGDFEELEPRNVTMPPRRVFEDDEGVKHLLIGTGEDGEHFEGMPLFSGGKWKTITREVSDEM